MLIRKPRTEQHTRIGQYFKDIVFAANDGIITTFAVVAGTAGAALHSNIILIVGISSLIADGISMATGNYLGTKSEKELYEHEEVREREEVLNIPEDERREVKEILEKKGFTGEKLEQMLSTITSNEKFWVDFMMHEELGLFLPDSENPLLHGLATFAAFIIAGALPLLPYLVIPGANSFFLAAAFSAAALFIVGALRSSFMARSWLISGIEMLVLGGASGGLAYLIGFVLNSILS